jgi:hypothetical protein
MTAFDPDDERMVPAFDAWNFRSDAGWTAEYDLIGYHIEATDGSIGKVTQTAHVTDQSYLVVDTGPWIFGRSVVLPAGTVTSIDHADRKIYVDRTKQQVKDSPDYDPATIERDDAYHAKLGDYYSSSYRDDDLSGRRGPSIS